LGKRKLILMYKWDTDEAIKLIKDHKVTNISGVPTQSWDLLNHPGVSKDDLSSLVDIGAGGAARPEDQVKELDDKFKIPLTFAWGMTETTALGTINRGQDYLDRPNSSGLSIPDLTEIAVIDDDWKFLVTGEIGEIVFKSPSNTKGYLKNKEETDKTIQNGWLKTGDLGYLDEDGYLYIVDRKKALIIRGGENISCLEVENALDKHPEIIESCVCGIEDQKFGEIVGAYIFCSSKVNEDEVKAFLKGKIADYKIPEKIKFTDSALPRIASQKLDRVGVQNLLSS
jgi:long-chain acyl-CoA synthetase